MTMLLGSIGEWPWIALAFALAHWKTAVAAVWGGGFAYLLFRDMKSWYKMDAYDASIGKRGDEEEIYKEIKSISRERRGSRMKTVLKSHLFWLPILAFDAGKKVARTIFYPVLAFLDKAQTEGIEKGKKGSSLPYAPQPPVAGPALAEGVLVEGVNAAKCERCGFLVPQMQVHTCFETPIVSAPVPLSPASSPARRKTVTCDDCGDEVAMDSPHACTGRDEDMVKCECGTRYRREDDFDHVCPDEDGDPSEAFCSDCNSSYDPTMVIHSVVYCKGCERSHCRRHDCGQVARI